MDVKYFHIHSRHILDNFSINRLSSKQQSIRISKTSNMRQNGKYNEIKGESRLQVVFIYHERLLDIRRDQRMHIIRFNNLFENYGRKVISSDHNNFQDH